MDMIRGEDLGEAGEILRALACEVPTVITLAGRPDQVVTSAEQIALLRAGRKRGASARADGQRQARPYRRWAYGTGTPVRRRVDGRLPHHGAAPPRSISLSNCRASSGASAAAIASTTSSGKSSTRTASPSSSLQRRALSVCGSCAGTR